MKWFQLAVEFCDGLYFKLIFSFDLTVHLHVPLSVHACSFGNLCALSAAPHPAHVQSACICTSH